MAVTEDFFKNGEVSDAFARNSDPWTSDEAAKSAKAAKWARAYVEMLIQFGPSTTSEIAVNAKRTTYPECTDGCITPRSAPLERRGVIVRVVDANGNQVTRKSLYSNRQQIVWALKKQISSL